MKRAMVVLFATALLGVAAAQNPPRDETLYITGHQWGPPNSFNPVGPVRAWPVDEGGGFNLIYESLFTYNLLTGELDPRLGATSGETEDTFVVTLHEGTAFQDGEPLTSEDVVYGFELGQRQSVEYSNVWDYVTAVEATDDRTVTFPLNQENLNLGAVRGALTGVAILPEHIWALLEEQEESLVQIANLEPVGSGPYTLSSGNNERVILEHAENYWGGAKRSTACPPRPTSSTPSSSRTTPPTSLFRRASSTCRKTSSPRRSASTSARTSPSSRCGRRICKTATSTSP